MNLTTAHIIATLAHYGQVDKAGLPYIGHPERVSASVPEPYKVVAMLHDVVEDTHVTLDELRDWGLSPVDAKALALLTHDPAIPYMDYIRGVKSNEIARTVKLADIADNMRPGPPSEAREAKYREALAILSASPYTAHL
jgi:hypothetical protein